MQIKNVAKLFVFSSSDGRLSESDQILAINGQRVDAVMSHQEAINLLQQTTGIVELIVARGGIPNAKNQVSPQESINSSTLSDTSLTNQVRSFITCFRYCLDKYFSHPI